MVHANCHMSVMYTKWISVDLMAEHMGIHVAQTAEIGHSMVMLSAMLVYQLVGHKNSFGHNAEASMLLRSNVTFLNIKSNTSPHPDQG